MPRRRARASAAASLVTLAAATVLAAPAPAAVTLGPPLTTQANVTGGCTPAIVFVAPGLPGAPSCTMLGADPSGQWTMQTPRGQWVITRARIRAGAASGPMVFTIIRATRSQASPGGGAAGLICCTVPVESQVVTPTPGTVSQFAVRLPVKNTVDVISGEPIETVDYLAISTLGPATSPPVFQGPGAGQTSYIAPAVRAGQERLSDGTSFTPSTPLIQGDYEPDADGDGFGDETQDSCATDAAIRSAPVARAAQCRAPASSGTPGPTGAGTPAASSPVLAGLPATLRRVTPGRRSFTLPVACPAATGASCTGTVSARTTRRLGRARVTLASKRFTAKAGRTVNVRLLLPASLRRALARGRAIGIAVTVRQKTPAAGTTTARVTLRRR